MIELSWIGIINIFLFGFTVGISLANYIAGKVFK